MSAKHALLGLLLDRPAYPYELADRMLQRLGPAWAVNSGQLYQTIKRLEADGLIERVDRTGGARDDRHVFSITDDGVAEFTRWFDETAVHVRLSRRPLLVQITFAGPERLKDALAKIDAYEFECVGQLNELSRAREGITADGPLVRADHLLLRLNLAADITQLEGELKWARHAREMVSWLLARDAVWPSTRESSDEARERRRARSELFGRMAGSAPESGNDSAHQRLRGVGGDASP